MVEESQILLRVTDDQRLAEEWALVLLAQGLSPSMRRGREGIVLSVPEAEVERALASLSAYEQENPRKGAQRAEPIDAGSVLAGIAVGLMLLLYYLVMVQWLPMLSWLERGSADAQLIIQGQLWRTVTALTLHVDVAHALSNAVAVALFFSAVSSQVGVGLGGALVLLAGAGGNLANAFLHGSPHVSVGASTAVFGMLGILGGLAVKRRGHRALSRWHAWMPVAASLAFSGWSGLADRALIFGLISAVSSLAAY